MFTSCTGGLDELVQDRKPREVLNADKIYIERIQLMVMDLFTKTDPGDLILQVPQR